MNILLDTNILTRWVNTVDSHHAETVEALRLLRTNGHTLSLVPQNLYEFWVVATRPIAVNGLSMTSDETRTELEQFSPPLFTLLLDERAILPRWQELVTKYDVKGKPAHDARLVAAMIRHGLTHLLTFNVRDFIRFTEISAIHPDAIISGTVTL